MNVLHQSIQSAFTNTRAEQDEMGDQYFDEAKHKLMKDLVDFNNREDFEYYMRGLETNYYDQLNFPKPPYESLPDYPPKPFQSQKKKREKDDQKKDYIDRVNDINLKRQQSYSGQSQQNQYQQQAHNQSYEYMQKAQQSLNINQTPFFDQVVNKENFQKVPSYGSISIGGASRPPSSLQTPKYTPIGQPQSGIPQGYSGDMYGKVMEPPKMVQQPPYFQRFVAGPTRMEHNPLSEPTRQFHNQSSPHRQQFEMNNYDLKNPDVQFERYKQLMSNQYYNQHANSAQMGLQIAQAHSSYHPQSHNHFAGSSLQHMPPHQDKYTMSFNPQTMNNSMPQQPHQNWVPKQISQVYPNQLYNRPNSSVSLYNQSIAPNQAYNHQQQHLQYAPGYEKFKPEFYRSLQQNNGVNSNIIESLGGISDTIKPLQESLKQHELRPFYIQKDYQKELKRSTQGHRSNSAREMKAENMKLVSVSPFRAVLKYDENKKQNQSLEQDRHNNNNGDTDNDEDEEDDSNEDKLDMYNQINGIVSRNTRGNQGQSSIGNDSQYLRGQKEHFLKSFNEQKDYFQQPQKYDEGNEGDYAFGRQGAGSVTNKQSQVPQNRSQQKQYRKMKNQSEYLRGQREGFLNSFSNSRLSNGFPELEEEGQNFDYRQHDSIY